MNIGTLSSRALRLFATCILKARTFEALSAARVACVIWLALSVVCGAARATSIEVLWYSYADPTSEYIAFYSGLAGSGPGSAASYPQGDGLEWNVSFFGPSSSAPSFSAYDVLVIASGEAFRTGAPGGPLATPDYSGILANRSAIDAARGNRTFLSGADADFHAVRGDSGLCPGMHCAAFDGARGYVINAVNWAATGAGLGILSFYHGEFPGSFWWDDPQSFLRDELMGNWVAFRENSVVIPVSASGLSLNDGLTATGLSNWTWSFHGGFSNIPNYLTTVDSATRTGVSVSIATVQTCMPGGGRNCISVTLDEPSSAALLAAGLVLLAALRLARCASGMCIGPRRRTHAQAQGARQRSENL